MNEYVKKQDPHLRGSIDLQEEVIQEPLLGRECANSNDALRQLSKIGIDRRAGIGLHPAEILDGVEVSNGKLIVCISDEGGRYKEGRRTKLETRLTVK